MSDHVCYDICEECAAEAGYADGLREGAERERAAVVAWLRNGDKPSDEGNFWAFGFAEVIEQKHHLRPDGGDRG